MFLVMYLYSINILDLVEYYFCLNNVFSKILAKYLGGNILNLVECFYVLLIFFFISVVYVLKNERQNQIIYFFR